MGRQSQVGMPPRQPARPPTSAGPEALISENVILNGEDAILKVGVTGGRDIFMVAPQRLSSVLPGPGGCGPGRQRRRTAARTGTPMWATAAVCAKRGPAEAVRADNRSGSGTPDRGLHQHGVG
jgi:hypothetical protein